MFYIKWWPLALVLHSLILKAFGLAEAVQKSVGIFQGKGFEDSSFSKGLGEFIIFLKALLLKLTSEYLTDLLTNIIHLKKFKTLVDIFFKKNMSEGFLQKLFQVKLHKYPFHFVENALGPSKSGLCDTRSFKYEKTVLKQPGWMKPCHTNQASSLAFSLISLLLFWRLTFCFSLNGGGIRGSIWLIWKWHFYFSSFMWCSNEIIAWQCFT